MKSSENFMIISGEMEVIKFAEILFNMRSKTWQIIF